MKPQRTFDGRKHGLSLLDHAMIDTEVPGRKVSTIRVWSAFQHEKLGVEDSVDPHCQSRFPSWNLEVGACQCQ